MHHTQIKTVFNITCIAVRKALIDLGFYAISSGSIRKIAKAHYKKLGRNDQAMNLLQGLTVDDSKLDGGVSRLMQRRSEVLQWWAYETHATEQ